MNFTPQENTITPESEPARRKYATPRLLVYGDIRDLTNAAGNKTNADGGMGSTDKTA